MTAPFTRTWTTEDMALLEQGIAAGTPWEELARQLGRSVNAVKIRQRLFFPRPLDPAVNYGWGRGRPGRQAYWTLARVQDGLRLVGRGRKAGRADAFGVYPPACHSTGARRHRQGGHVMTRWLRDLEPVTHRVNLQRGVQGAKTHCKHGHELTGDNLYLARRKDGSHYRQCRPCVLRRLNERRKAIR